VRKKHSVSNIGEFSVEPEPLVKVYCSKKNSFILITKEPTIRREFSRDSDFLLAETSTEIDTNSSRLWLAEVFYRRRFVLPR